MKYLIAVVFTQILFSYAFGQSSDSGYLRKSQQAHINAQYYNNDEIRPEYGSTEIRNQDFVPVAIRDHDSGLLNVKFKDDKQTVAKKLAAKGCQDVSLNEYVSGTRVVSSNCNVFNLKVPCPAGYQAKWYDNEDKSFKLCVKTESSKPSKLTNITH